MTGSTFSLTSTTPTNNLYTNTKWVSSNTLQPNILQPNILQINNKNIEVLKITPDGDFYIKGNLISTDKDLVRYLKVISKSNYKETLLNDVRKDPDLFQDIVTILRREKINNILNR